MESITLDQINKKGNTINFCFSVSNGLKQYFSGKVFEIIYPQDITSVPDAVAAIPFVCNVLPIIWLTDSRLNLPELEKSFYNCIPNVKNGYEEMFPESTFAGEIVVNRVISCDVAHTGKSAVFFSGGLDATQTLVSHIQEAPDLISIWGADIKYGNQSGWDIVHDQIANTSERFGLLDVVIRSSFREFDNEDVLHRTFCKQLQDGWWHGVKHGLGLLGHAAPYVYLQNISKVYIAASNCPNDGVVRCASHPSTDNHVRFCGCRVVHDGFEYSRQDKAKNVVKFCNESGCKVTLHACWQSQTGNNCCHCEKCYRTMAALMAEGADPAEYGFEMAYKTLPDMQRYVLSCAEFNANVAISYWKHIHDRVLVNKKLLKRKGYWKYLRWIAKADFLEKNQLKLPLQYRIRAYLSRYKFYQLLSNIKRVLH